MPRYDGPRGIYGSEWWWWWWGWLAGSDMRVLRVIIIISILLLQLSLQRIHAHTHTHFIYIFPAKQTSSPLSPSLSSSSYVGLPQCSICFEVPGEETAAGTLIRFNCYHQYVNFNAFFEECNKSSGKM